MTRFLLNMSGLAVYGVDQKKTGAIEEYRADLADFEQINPIIKQIRPDYIINLAGLNQADNPSDLYTANVFPVIHALRSLNINGLQGTNLFLISSAAVYGDSSINPLRENAPLKPVNVYGASKLAMEQLLPVLGSTEKCRVMVARTFNLFGPGLPEKLSIPSFIKQLVAIKKGKSKPVIKVGNLEPKRDYLDIRDAVKAYWKIVTDGNPGEIYNVGTGKSVMMKEILNMLIQETGVEVTIETNSQLVRTNEIMVSVADIKKIKELGWSPEMDLKTSILDMIAYYQHGK